MCLAVINADLLRCFSSQGILVLVVVYLALGILTYEQCLDGEFEVIRRFAS